MSENPPRARWTEQVRTAALWLRDTGLGGFGFTLVLVVAVSGWAASFIGLHAFGMQHMGLSRTSAWLVPITFDGAPAGLSIVVARAATHGRPALAWRLLIIGFTGLSSWINYEHIDDDLGRIVASFMPPSAVILFEGLMSEARAAAARRNGRNAPRLHPLRWVFDRKGTLAILRAYVLGLELPEPLQQAAETAAAGAPTERSGTRPESAPAPAPVSLSKASQGAPAAAPKAPQSAAPVAPQSAPKPAPVSLVKAPQSAPTPAPVSPQSSTPKAPQGAPAAASKAPRKTPSKRPGRVTRADAQGAIRALYDELGRRPLESEMVDRLKEIKYEFTSRQHANRLRGELEEKEPHLAALGSTNVTALTGS
ncbi:uncharacterized protein DUF2637 [Streptomyces sp. Ag109_O5-1]|uniref:DUF2637 domain-containing protein n=1 Tax=Streptomyces sp. Ag109_O5-1 TaxID=1938851 RepID=UPI000F4D64A3|nr:DUF2637 domain-containing protein [Streptomyces sp. Ag109_O5-1]RPE39778.1 uncharacterized protein DUF2637 [Streptomyces sp. Ag109_O5-1]